MPTRGCSSRLWQEGSTGFSSAMRRTLPPCGRSSRRAGIRFSRSGCAKVSVQGRRGAGGQGGAAGVWGLPTDEYPDRADPWPLNPDGELLLGVKIENRRALATAEEVAKVSGLGFGEWGLGDMGMSFGYRSAHAEPYPDELSGARSKVMSSCKKAGLFFLDGASSEDVVGRIEEGVMICACRSGEDTAKIGRAHTERTMEV